MAKIVWEHINRQVRMRFSTVRKVVSSILVRTTRYLLSKLNLDTYGFTSKKIMEGSSLRYLDLENTTGRRRWDHERFDLFRSCVGLNFTAPRR
jgi:hypothetical protein